MAKSTQHGQPGSTPGKQLKKVTKTPGSVSKKTTKGEATTTTPASSTKKSGGGSGSASASKQRKAASRGGGEEEGEKRWRPLPVRLDFGSAFTRHVFLRAPTKGAEGAVEGLALFVAAVPAGWGDAHLAELMSAFGAVAEAGLAPFAPVDDTPDGPCNRSGTPGGVGRVVYDTS
jgi:hypothetical protein